MALSQDIYTLGHRFLGNLRCVCVYIYKHKRTITRYVDKWASPAAPLTSTLESLAGFAQEDSAQCMAYALLYPRASYRTEGATNCSS